MAKEDEAAAPEPAARAVAPPKPAKSSKKLLLFVIAPLLVLLLAGGGAYFFLGGKKEETPAEAPPPPPKPAVYYKLPEFLVNLNSRAGRSTFLKLTISLEFESEADVVRVQAVMPRVVDNIQALLRELRTEDLKNTAALSRLREELLARVNAAVQPVRANDVLFQEVLLQ